jgi:hypothetical protein
MDEVVRPMIERLRQEAAAEQREILVTAAYLLTGLRVSRDITKYLFRGVSGMHESDTYQAILEEGEEKGCLKEAKKLLLRLGSVRFGAPDETAQATLTGLNNLEQVEELTERVLHVESWQDLIAAP